MITGKKLLELRDTLEQFEKERTAYRIWKNPEGGENLKRSTVYERVKELADCGLIEKTREESSFGPLPKKFYKLTHRGHRIIKLANEIEELLEPASDETGSTGRGTPERRG